MPLWQREKIPPLLLAEDSLMRRKDQEIADRSVIDAIIEKALVCRLAMCDGDRPYLVPMCFGCDGKNLYVHSARGGQKLDILTKNPQVCFEIEGTCEIERADQACDWGMKYTSVIGSGIATILDDAESKRKALDIIVRQYSHTSYDYPEKMVNALVVIRVDIEELTGRHSN